jgi:hypothetical protein
LPYEKSFIAGGANDIRAWRLRSLGPGSYSDSKIDNFDRIVFVIYPTPIDMDARNANRLAQVTL